MGGGFCFFERGSRGGWGALGVFFSFFSFFLFFLCSLFFMFFAVFFAVVQGAAADDDGGRKNGFDLSGAVIPVEEILHGGPQRDGIPSIDVPQFVTGEMADEFLHEKDLILGVVVGDEARAYPIKILNWHEIVNDRIGDVAMAITYCPLCGSGVVFAAEIDGAVLQFGVSGLLYNSDVLLYDRQSESLWSQLLRRGISGDYAGTALQTLPSQHTTWQAWQKMHPQSAVLSPQTGFVRDYDTDPYAGYAESARIYFPTKSRGEAKTALADFHAKEWVLGVVVGDAVKSYPFSQLHQQGLANFDDVVGGQTLTIEWDAEAESATAMSSAGDISVVRAFWFAWHAFYPQGDVFVVE